MNISSDYNLIFLAVPRTGCRTAYRYLKHHLNFEGTVPSHSMKLPTECHHYELMTVVRNPYSRAVSCWGWHRRLASQIPNNRPLFGSQEEEWSDFSRTMLEAYDRFPHYPRGWAQFRTQEFYLSQVEERDFEMLRFETLRDELQKYISHYKKGVVLPAKLAHRSEINYRSPWQKFYERDPELVKLVTEMFDDDFDYCFYDRGVIPE